MKYPRRRILIFPTFLFVIFRVFCGSPSFADTLDERFLAGLRERHLFHLAERFGEQLADRVDLSDDERAHVAIQRAMLHAQHAEGLPPPSRDEAWAKAEHVCTTFLQRWPTNPKRSLVEVQRGLLDLRRGAQLVEESVGTAQETAQLAESRVFLRMAGQRLSRIAATVQEELAQRHASHSLEHGLSIGQMESLLRNVSFHVAQVYRFLARCYPRASADRDSALLQALERLGPLARQQLPDELSWQARLEMIRCQRELGQLQAANELLKAWLPKATPQPKVVALLAAEQVRLLLEAGKEQEAMEAANRALQKGEAAIATPELALAHLEASVAIWKQAQAKNRAEAWVGANVLTKELATIRAQQGPKSKWARRAELLVGRALARSMTKENGQPRLEDVETLVLAAENLFHQGQSEKSLAIYDRAIGALEQAEQIDRAFELTRTAAAIESQMGQLAAAASRCQQFALHHPKHPQSAKMHHSALRTMATLLRTSQPETRPPLLLATKKLLQEHIAHWPQTETASAARLSLEKLTPHRPGQATERQALAIVDQAQSRNANAISANRLEERVAEYKQLAEKFPKEGTIQEAYAVLLSRSERPNQLQLAFDRWTEVERQCQQSGPRWKRARRARIEILQRLGKQTEAEKLERLTRLLYPG